MNKIIFQNEHFVVCDKPALVLSVPAREKTDQRPCLGLDLQKHFKTQVFPVHRLDYEVSGLIIYALNSQSHKESQKWFLDKKIQKKYCAITGLQDFSHWPAQLKTERTEISSKLDQKLIWKTQILRGKKRSFESEQGEWAETEALISARTETQIEWTLLPLTGKPHQLRFELSRHGFPIRGDALYGSKQDWKEPGIALKAYELDLSKIKNTMGLPEILTITKWNA
jgi:tRNA pseudouridine32 synthase/23S rRNA pseudouridine746 synthase